MPSRPWALVTGGGRRLGAAFVTTLAKNWNVWVHCNTSGEEAAALAAKLSAPGRTLRVVQADLAAPGGAEGLMAQLEEARPRLIVHSASAWTEDTAASARQETWESLHRLHVWSALVFAKALSQGQEDSHLITLLDGRLRDRDPQHFSYAFAKRELALLTRYLAAELAPRVRVNGLAPGLILRSEGTGAARWSQIGRESTPLARTGSTAELVKALRYLVHSPFVTGQILAVDGGRHLKGDLFGSL